MFDQPFETLNQPAFDDGSLFEEDKKKFVCSQPGCGKIFRYKSEIVRHIATHSEARPFVCQYDNCFKAFKRTDALENHVRSSHTKETPFTCPVPDCGMKFTTHGSFRYHVLKHNKKSVETPTEIAPVMPQARKQIKTIPEPVEASFFTQEFPTKSLVGLKGGKEDVENVFSAPAPRFASKIQWEMVNDETENSSPSTHTEDSSQQDKLNVVMEENKMLKQRLETSEKVIKNMQKQINDLLGNLFAYQSNEVVPTPAFTDFTSPKAAFTQETFSESKPAEEPMFDMINYGEDMNLANLAFTSEPSFRKETSIDAFLSFGNSFDF